MTVEILRTQEELRNLIDTYAYLGDEKKISEQMGLFTRDALYKAYMNDFLAANVSGTENLEKEFNGHASLVKTYFTMNGQHTVKIDGDTATGVSFSQIKMIRESEGKNIITDYSVKYDDKYVCQNGKWLIKERTGYFIIVEARPLNN
ncbi:SnoaL-like domain-containing protein [Chitinophaga sp. YR573]|uniref:nuclear transport factor 2 family protein n=1 Tax=Chitinophaga sp. YR573 TaxID=1881040 RepID=UPI0008CE42FE|nr:nuclear transport factor 2 family protein [Chitinophaga sp. YR573]SEV91975.1 SnoaL-like domain-containing protein [Chitinophaga sp. YR573]